MYRYYPCVCLGNHMDAEDLFGLATCKACIQLAVLFLLFIFRFLFNWDYNSLDNWVYFKDTILFLQSIYSTPNLCKNINTFLYLCIIWIKTIFSAHFLIFLKEIVILLSSCSFLSFNFWELNELMHESIQTWWTNYILTPDNAIMMFLLLLKFHIRRVQFY